MKRILITGTHSYIGDSFFNFMSRWREDYLIESIDLRKDTWKNQDFSSFDVIFHVTGIAHRKETEDNAHEYFEVNRDLAIAVAKKAKAEEVKQFIFLSSGTIYGIETGVITKDTPINAKTYYGKSKAEAEVALRGMEDDNFRVTILRPLMVYGKGCKGNFQTIIKIVKKSPIFPRTHNHRSLIYIDNLSSFVKMAIDQELSGTYFPKNKEDVDTYDIVNGVAEALGKTIYMSWLLGGLIYLFRGFFSVTRKAFTDMIYENTEDFDYSYCVVNGKDSIFRSV